MKRLLAKLRALFRKEKLDRDMAEEMRFHLNQRTAGNIDDGMLPDEARYAALRKFGGIEQLKEHSRDQRGFVWLEQLAQDVRHGARALRKNPGFTAVALLTLALGIGANTAMFSLLNTFLLQAVPYDDPGRLVRVYRTSPQAPRAAHAPANYFDLRAGSARFNGMAAYGWRSYNRAEPGQPAEQMRGVTASAEIFAVLGLQPELGRAFSAEEEQPGRNQVALLTQACWRGRFGGDPQVLGRTLRLDGETVTIIGVLPAVPNEHLLWGRMDVWRPLALSVDQRQSRGSTWLEVVARLKPAVSREQAQAEMDALAAGLATAHPRDNAHSGLRLVPMEETRLDATQRRVVWLAMGLAGFVLLIACANLANLLFARTAGRAREYAVRVALGAPRWTILRQLLTESLMLSIAGGGLGLALAPVCSRLLARFMVFDSQVGVSVALDPRVLAFTLLVSLFTAVAFGTLPAWAASRTDVNEALKQGRGGGRGTLRLRRVLIVGEVALALVLLAGAAMFAGGLRGLLQRDPGWRADGVVAGYLSLQSSKYRNPPDRLAFFERLGARLAAIPGVERASISSALLPSSFMSRTDPFTVESQPAPTPGREPVAYVNLVGPDYFETIGVRLQQGRTIARIDDAKAPRVVIINQAMARHFWPGENPIGKRLGGRVQANRTWEEIVGVVGDVRNLADLAGRETRFQIYRPLAQSPVSFVAVALRSGQSAESMAPLLRRAVAEVDPEQPVLRLGTPRQTAETELANYTVLGWMLAGFALLGLLLAALGLYGVISGLVVQRTREIGLRMALGAQVRDVIRLVIGQGSRLAVIGTLIGIGGAFALGRLLRSIAPELLTHDPLIVAFVAALLLAVAMMACWLPARRAAKVDPLVALRAE